MAESFVGKMLEFIMGLILVPISVGGISVIISMFILPRFTGADPTTLLPAIIMNILRFSVLGLLLWRRRIVAMGYLVELTFELTGVIPTLPYLFYINM